MFQHKSAYPVVLVPGLVGYGEENAFNKVLPYFGLTATSAQKVIRDMGIPCHAPNFGALSGVWARACELYAQIVGGTVDYGEAHSKKYGHPRYGKTYQKAMVPDWGSLDDEGKVVKINLIAHGFGAPVARLFVELLNNGSEEERATTKDGTLSALFVGGYNNIVHSLVSIAGINDGITAFQAFEDRVPGATRSILKGCVAFEELKLRTGYIDPYYAKQGIKVTQYGLSAVFNFFDKNSERKPIEFDEFGIDRYLALKEGNIFYETSIPGMKEINNRILAHENTYYFSITGSVTSNLLGKVTIPKLSAGLFAPTALLISTFENYYTDKPIVTPVYHENDGLVNTESSLAPVSETATAYKNPSKCQPGIWYQMPVENKNHLAFMGLGQRPDVYRNCIYDLIKIISNLEIV